MTVTDYLNDAIKGQKFMIIDTQSNNCFIGVIPCWDDLSQYLNCVVKYFTAVDDCIRLFI